MWHMAFAKASAWQAEQRRRARREIGRAAKQNKKWGAADGCRGRPPPPGEWGKSDRILHEKREKAWRDRELEKLAKPEPDNRVIEVKILQLFYSRGIVAI